MAGSGRLKLVWGEGWQEVGDWSYKSMGGGRLASIIGGRWTLKIEVGPQNSWD